MSRKDHILREKFRSLAERQEYSGGQLIFSEGDAADYIYFRNSQCRGGNRHTEARRILR